MARERCYRSPDFIGIGFRRCASSWLHACLSEHPEIGKPLNGLHFFSREENYKKGIGWYEEQLQYYANKKIIGEFSVSYAYPNVYKRVAERIFKHYPHAKIICTVRNPIERAYSDYLRSVKYSELDKTVSFEQAIRMDPNFINRGYYGKILNHYLNYFSGRLLVLVYDDLKDNPLGFIKKVYSFLGVDRRYIPSILLERRGPAFVPKSQTIQSAIYRVDKTLSQFIGKKGMDFIKSLTKALGIRNLVKKLNPKVIPLIRNETRRILYDIYQDDIQELSSLLGKDLSFWGETVQ